MAELNLREQKAEETRGLDCVEIYLPKKLTHLSELYNLLRNTVTSQTGWLSLDGFSIYEVDGFFRGAAGKPWEERSLVIRLLLARPRSANESQLRARIREFGREIGRIAASEEEVWICDFRQRVTIFRPNTSDIP